MAFSNVGSPLARLLGVVGLQIEDLTSHFPLVSAVYKCAADGVYKCVADPACIMAFFINGCILKYNMTYGT